MSTLVAGVDVAGPGQDRTVATALNGTDVSQISVLPRGLTFAQQRDLLLPVLSRCSLVCVDATGLGLGLAELLTEALPSGVVVSVIIGAAGGDLHPYAAFREPPLLADATHYGPAAPGKNVPSRVVFGKEALIRGLKSAIRERTLRIPIGTANAQYLIDELRRFVVKPGNSGRMKYEAASNSDDAVLSSALSVLAREIHGKAEKVRRAGAN